MYIDVACLQFWVFVCWFVVACVWLLVCCYLIVVSDCYKCCSYVWFDCVGCTYVVYLGLRVGFWCLDTLLLVLDCGLVLVGGLFALGLVWVLLVFLLMRCLCWVLVFEFVCFDLTLVIDLLYLMAIKCLLWFVWLFDFVYWIWLLFSCFVVGCWSWCCAVIVLVTCLFAWIVVCWFIVRCS